ncbi:hypothetical protein SteCoe_9634 [Stentor coeruleus]|uniref:Uncharacterized protein n=1 Tax=Stentor coeruleus TaxID=5963 RepID=A0A1R2CHI4_9CILI|nr:hypothetical protein SteCoe_9634 [Stentor coeruleus]
MQKSSDRATLACLLNKPPDISNFKMRKSFDIFESRRQGLVSKKNSHYRALKKPILGFKEELYFVHKLCRNRSRPVSAIKSSKTEPQKIESPKVESIKQILPERSIIAIPKPETTEILRSKTPSVQNSMKSIDNKPQRPKIIIKTRSRKSSTLKPRQKNKEYKDFEEIKGWGDDIYD